MDEIRRRFLGEISARLFAAAESDAKTEMIEELTDNLYNRYLDLTAAGIGPEEAFQRAMDNLGDVEELISYLNGETAGEGAAYTAETADGDPFWDIIRGAEKVVSQAFTTAKSAWHTVRDTIREDGRFQWQSQGGHFDINVDLTGKGTKYTPETEGTPIRGPIPAHSLRGIDVQNVNGDVTVSMTEAPGGDIQVGGDIDKLEISFAADGVLIIRPLRTAASSMLSRRGVMAADIDIRLPFRRWDVVQIASVNGDIDITGGEAGQVYIRTVSGDVQGRVSHCDQLTVDSISGDVHWRGDLQDVQVKTMSGDVYYEGRAEAVLASSNSGDIELAGAVSEVKCAAASGDIRVETGALPRAMALTSKSGDCQARIPDAGSFSIELKTVSGSVDYQFPLSWTGGVGVYGEGDRPAYTVTSVSGDVRLERY